MRDTGVLHVNDNLMALININIKCSSELVICWYTNPSTCQKSLSSELLYLRRNISFIRILMRSFFIWFCRQIQKKFFLRRVEQLPLQTLQAKEISYICRIHFRPPCSTVFLFYTPSFGVNIWQQAPVIQYTQQM